MTAWWREAHPRVKAAMLVLGIGIVCGAAALFALVWRPDPVTIRTPEPEPVASSTTAATTAPISTPATAIVVPGPSGPPGPPGSTPTTEPPTSTTTTTPPPTTQPTPSTVCVLIVCTK